MHRAPMVREVQPLHRRALGRHPPTPPHLPGDAGRGARGATGARVIGRLSNSTMRLRASFVRTYGLRKVSATYYRL